jgi:prepilin-type N-terminal cleavage/methylation domain-containing protein
MTRVSQRGFTLVELMISVTLFSIVVAGIMAVAIAMTGGFREQRALIASESAARNALDYIGDAIRNVSPGVPSGDIQVVASHCSPDMETIEVVNNSDAPDELIITYGSGSVVTSTRSVYGAGATSLVVENYEQLREGDTLLITDLTRGVLVDIEDAVTSQTLTIAAQQCASLTFPAGGFPTRSLVIRAMRARFFVNDLEGVPALWMDPDAEGPRAAEPLAEGIEDMQIAIARDADDNDVINEVGDAANDDEWQHNVAEDDVLAGALRAVRITLVARTSSKVGVARYKRPAAEDRPEQVSPDVHSRRVLTTIVEVRNLRGSP